MKSSKGIKVLLIAGIVTCGAWFAYYYASDRQHYDADIFEYKEGRDARDIHNLFKKDWYWLSARDYKPEQVDWMITTGSPNEYEPEYFGKMKFKVLRVDGKFAGFASYYLKNFYTGAVLFLAVEPDVRSKGYGFRLLKEAVRDLFAQGAQVVTLNVRENNARGRAFYVRSGFTEISNEGGFVVVKVEKPV